MLAVFITWIICFIIIFSFGFGVVEVVRIFNKNDKEDFSIDVYYFTGLTSISLILGILSIFMAIDITLLILFLILSVLIVLFHRRRVLTLLYAAFKHRILNLFIVGIVLLFLSVLVHEIILSDTALYHTQSIKWIRHYPVVPGLGNIHGRFAFNSMFFVLSSLFTFEIQNVIIYPLNGLTLVVLLVKLYTFSIELKDRNSWKVICCLILTVLLLNWLLPFLNSPSPDIMLTIMVVYLFITIVELNKFDNIDISIWFLINFLIFSCIVFKLSSVLCIVALIPFWIKLKSLNKIVASAIVGLLILLPYFIRNYYLSGYLIYPFPTVDIFQVDWKIPLKSVINEREWIESWARIPGSQPSKVLSLSIKEWIKPWIKVQNNLMLVILAGNLLSFVLIFVAIFKRNIKIAIIFFILLINILFWFINAPDPRFIYGFLFINFAFSLAYVFKIINWSFIFKFLTIKRYLYLGLLLIFLIKFKPYPLKTMKNSNLWILPIEMHTPKAETIHGNFTYIHTLDDHKCYNTDLPCVPYKLNEHVELRGESIKDGFKVVQDKNTNNKIPNNLM